MPVSTLRAALGAVLLGLPLAAAAQPGPPPTSPPVGTVTVDGMLTDTPYTLLATNAGGPAPSFSGSNQLTALYARVQGSTLYLGIGGNIENNNRLVVFVDSRANGYTTGDFGAAGPGGVSNFKAGHQFDVGFTADFAIAIGTDGAPPDQNGVSNYYVNVVELGGTRAAGGSSDRYLGSNRSPNIAGAAIAAAVTTDPANRTRGFELQIPIGATASASTPIASDRQSMQFFALVTGDSGYLSNSFLSPAATTQTADVGDAVVNFETAAPDPVSFVFQPIAGRAGWRQLAWPVQGGVVGNYAAQNHVQGPGTAFPSGSANVILSRSSVYNYATNLADPLASGRGQFWYHYDQADFPGGVVPTGSNFQPRPYTLVAGGTEPQANVQLTVGEVFTGFVMAGNPFSLDFDTQGLIVNGGVVAGPLVYAWDPDAGTAGGYVQIDRNAAAQADRTVAPMQGFWVETVPSTALAPDRPDALGLQVQFTYLQGSRVQGNEPLVARTAAQRVLAFNLDRLTAAGPAPEWHAARLAFVEGAVDGPDAFDGGLPPAIGPDNARIGFLATGDDGQPVYRGQESRGYDLAAPAEARLALSATAAAAYRLSWPGLDALPATWAATLSDGDTGETVDLRTADHYDFTAAAGDWTSRFTVRVAPRATSGEAAPAAAGLGAAAPNPASGETRIALAVDRPQHVRAELFDSLGRRVALVFDAAVDAPRDLTVDVRGLSAGVYVLRVTGDTFAASRQITVTR